MNERRRDEQPLTAGEPPPGDADVRATLRARYGEMADGTLPAADGCCTTGGPSPTTAGEKGSGAGPHGALAGPSLGCGNPVALAELEAGQTVLDLGCGSGRDCFLAAQRVGPSGAVIGVDMTAAMLEVARANRGRLGARNVDFRLGEIEHLPVADGSVDVVMSNCVINLSPDRPQVFREAFRALRPGGKLAVCDMMTDRPVPEALRAALGDAGGSLVAEDAYLAAIRGAGFVDVELQRAYPDPALAQAAQQRLTAGGEAGTVAVVRIAETGEERTVRLDEIPEGTALRSFSGSVTARKPR